jgi:hypothetical protein
MIMVWYGGTALLRYKCSDSTLGLTLNNHTSMANKGFIGILKKPLQLQWICGILLLSFFLRWVPGSGCPASLDYKPNCKGLLFRETGTQTARVVSLLD